MKDKEWPSSISRETWILALAIARAIRYSLDEKDAVQRVCTLLGFWEVKIAPSELGAEHYDG